MSHLPFLIEIDELLGRNSGQFLIMENQAPALAELPKLPPTTQGEPKLLVTGGAGYIGSHVCALLRKQGYNLVIVDDLSSGHADAVGRDLVVGSLADESLLDKLFLENNIVAVLHFAGSIRVEESVENPGKYFDNNVVGSLNLINAMIRHGVTKLVYSSSAAVYGNPERIPIKEEDPKIPTNPYGESKLVVEKIIRNYHQNHGLAAVMFRYFNAAGASLDSLLGENHPVETHIIPRILDVALGTDQAFKVFGKDYPTRDGTAVRDYVHVLDLAEVHALAVKKLVDYNDVAVYNVGTGNGYSIMQVIQEVLEVTRRMVVCEPHPRRAGDPAILVADSAKLAHELGYQLQYSDLKTIIRTAWQWHRKLRQPQ